MPTPNASVSRARRALLDGGDLPDELRPEIRYSWLRSKMASVPLDRIDVPFSPLDDSSERLLAAARPVLERFSAQLAGTQVSLVLADRDARVIGRWAGESEPLHRLASVSIEEGFVIAEHVAGTNGIGTVIEERGPVLVRGPEHYVEPLHGFVCVGVPVRHPFSRRIEGVLDLACQSKDANRLLLPTAMDLAVQIEQELSTRVSHRERAVFERFLARCRETSAPVVALGEKFMLTNAASANVLEPADQPLLWEQASEAFGDDAVIARRFQLSGGDELEARCTPVRLGTFPVGALIEMNTVPRNVPANHVEPSVVPLPRAGDPTSTTDALLDRTADASVCRVRIVGEAGCGKLTLASRIHERRGDGGPFTVVPASLAKVDGIRAWVRAVRGRLADERGSVVIKNLEQLGEDGVQVLTDAMLHSDTRQPLVIATQTVAKSDTPDLSGDRFGGLLLRIPPLRERRTELPGLIETALRGADGTRHPVSKRAMAALCNYSWPGNLRQLESVLTEIADTIGPGTAVEFEHLPDTIGAASHGRRRKLTKMEFSERETIVDTLRRHGGNKIRTAQELGISRSTLYRKLRLFGLDADQAML